MSRKKKQKHNIPSNVTNQTNIKSKVLPVSSAIKQVEDLGINADISFDLEQADKFKKALPLEEHSNFHDWLDSFSTLAKAMLQKHEEAKKHLSDKKELETQKNNFQSKFDELKKLESELPERERVIEERELNARYKFAKQNEESVSKLKDEIEKHEKILSGLKKDIQNSNDLLSSSLKEQEEKLGSKERELESKEKKLSRDNKRIDQEWKDIEQEREELKIEIEKARNEERDELQSRIDKTTAKTEKAFAETDELREKLDDYEAFEKVLNGKSAKDFLKDYRSIKKDKQDLEFKLSESDTTSLERDNDGLKDKIHNLETRLKEVEPELIKKEAELSRQRLSILEKQRLTEEKKVLEKHKQVLSAHVNDLEVRIDQLTESQQAQSAFPALTEIDKQDKNKTPLEDISNLKDFAPELQRRIAYAEKGVVLNYKLEDIQILLGGLAMSQLHVFQGISGTGKTSLAKAFAKAMGGQCTDIAVQAGWRDRDDLLGHYNAFEKRFYEKDCLQGLYHSQTPVYNDRCNIILLDEMNLSRPEQYFAEFLSALEKNDPNERLITLTESKLSNTPKLLVQGRKIKVPENIWFIGTANHDETTNELADKTYDRSHVMVLPKHENSDNLEKIEPQRFSYSSLQKQFKKAQGEHEDFVKEKLKDLTTSKLSNELEKRFDFGWGNRFERQALRFIPVVMATGGPYELALDHLLSTRVFRQGKITGRYDASLEDIKIIKDQLEKLIPNESSPLKKSIELLEKDMARKSSGL